MFPWPCRLRSQFLSKFLSSSLTCHKRIKSCKLMPVKWVLGRPSVTQEDDLRTERCEKTLFKRVQSLPGLSFCQWKRISCFHLGSSVTVIVSTLHDLQFDAITQMCFQEVTSENYFLFFCMSFVGCALSSFQIRISGALVEEHKGAVGEVEHTQSSTVNYYWCSTNRKVRIWQHFSSDLRKY